MEAIRHADPARDARPCAAIYAPYVSDSHISFEEEPPTTDDMRVRIEAAHAWLVAEVDGTIAGYAYASPHLERAAYRWAADVAVYLDSGQRGRGLGRALYTELLGLLRERGVQVVCAGVTLPNDASVGLHDALGFERIGVYRQIGYKAGAWRDVAWWQLRLLPAEGLPPEPRSP